jgi:hypothetical protein
MNITEEDFRRIIARRNRYIEQQGKVISMLVAAMTDISRQPEGDEHPAQAVAREVLKSLEGANWYTQFEEDEV